MKKSFFQTNNQPYYVYAPDYRKTSAGIRAMHSLCHALNELGQEAYVVCNVVDEELRTPILTNDIVTKHNNTKKIPIALYPEVVDGNPLGLPVVARWLLNTPGHLGGGGYKDDDLLFCYGFEYVPDGMKAFYLHIPTIDNSVFNNDNNAFDFKRSGTCYYASKYLIHGGKLTNHVKKSTSLCHDIKMSQEEIASILRRSELLYCYEPSAIINEALLCGCPVCIVPTSYSRGFDEGAYGGVYGGVVMDDLPASLVYAKETVAGFTDKYNSIAERGWKCIETFIKRTQAAVKTQINDDWSISVINELKNLNIDNKVRIKSSKKVAIDHYKLWQEKISFSGEQVAFWQMHIEKLESFPTFHFLITLNEGEETLLADTLDSLSQQIYSNWHLSVVSALPCPDSIFDELDVLEWLQLKSSDNPYEVIDQCINANGFDWLCLIEPGSTFEPQLIASVASYTNTHKEWEFIYIDEDQLNESGQRVTPLFKPDFNLDLLRSSPYIGDFCFVKTSVLRKLGGFPVFPGAENYDLAFHILENSGEQAFGHIPDVLAHRSYHPAREFDAELGLQVLTQHLQRQNVDALATHSDVKGCFQVNYKLETSLKITIIIITKDQLSLLKACLESIIDNTSYPNYDVIVVDNLSTEHETKSYLAELNHSSSGKVSVMSCTQPYSISAINNLSAKQATGDYLVLLNNDTMVLQAEWLHGILSQVQRAEVGVVGVKLVSPNKKLLHTGIVLGMGSNGIAGNPHTGLAMESLGYMNRAMLVQECSAVSAACLMIEKKLYQQVGGLDEKEFKTSYNDVDLCLKVREQGYKVVWTPYVYLIHHDSNSLKKESQNERLAEQLQQEVDSIQEKWLPQLANDPAYNRNLSLKTTDYQVDNSLNCSWSVDFKDKPKVYAFPHDSYGVGQYRVRAPINALTRAGKIESSLANNWDELIYPTPVEIERIKPDVLLTQNAFLDHMRMPWQRYRQFNDAFMVCGLDDLVYMLPYQHPKQGEWPKNIRRKVKQLFQASDRIVVANDALAEEFSKMTDDIVVVPNYLENWRWDELKKPTKQAGKKLRVGWAGGSEHISDLIFILPIVEALHHEVDWVFMGLALEELKPFVKEFHAGVEFDFYPQKLANLNLDLAIAPLMHNRFNECKTNLRLLEYGIIGWPVVCSDILPYQNAPVTRVANNVNEWIRVIREKISEPDALLKEGGLLKQWVGDNYMLDDHLDEWVAALLPN